MFRFVTSIGFFFHGRYIDYTGFVAEDSRGGCGINVENLCYFTNGIPLLVELECDDDAVHLLFFGRPPGGMNRTGVSCLWLVSVYCYAVTSAASYDSSFSTPMSSML